MPVVWPSQPCHYDVSETKISGNHVQQDGKIISLYNNILIYYTNYHTSMINAVQPGHLGLHYAHMVLGMIPCLFYGHGCHDGGPSLFTDQSNHVGFGGRRS